MDTIYYIEIIGTFVFAISGVLAGVEKKFDIVGASILGFITAIGGGSIRDLLLGETPVSWMRDINYVFVIFSAVVVCYLGRKYVIKLRKGLFLFDTIGIGLFTIIGLEKTLSFELSPIIGILMGVVSAVFGGILRDVFSNEIPLIFRKEIYAMACLLGAVVYLVLNHFSAGSVFNMPISIFVVILIRYLSVRFEWSINFEPLN